MIKIGLDLAVRNVGIAISENNKIANYDSFVSKEKDYIKLQIEITDWVFNKITYILVKEHQLIIEDIYVGLDPTSSLDAAKTQGGVIDRYFQMTKKFPIIIGAMAARKLVGINSRASKAEIQLAVVERLKLGEIPNEVKGEVIRARNAYEIFKKEIAYQREGASKVMKEHLSKEQAQAKKDMDNTLKRLSTKITKLTGVNEHCADALVLIMDRENEQTI